MVAEDVPLKVTVNWPLRFVGLPLPVTLTPPDGVMVNRAELLFVNVIETAVGAGTLPKASKISMFAWNVLGPLPRPLIALEHVIEAPFTLHCESCITEAAAALIVSVWVPSVKPPALCAVMSGLPATVSA